MFSGTYTALVTPFTPDGDLDLDTLRKLVERQVEGGVDGIVPMGTTGESPTVDFEEHQRVISTTVEAAAGRCKVIAGTGGNATAEAELLTRHAKDAGADATLQVTPYYNKPSQEGLYRHFSRIADIGLPVVLYNIPGRTSKEIELSTMIRLAAHPQVVAVKEAAGSVDAACTIVRETGLAVLSGDDPLTLPMMIVGASGVVSVASNVLPAEVTSLTHAALARDWEKARELHQSLCPLFGAMLKLDTNPIPVKTALALMGLVEEHFRLPMCEIADEGRVALREILQSAGLL